MTSDEQLFSKAAIALRTVSSALRKIEAAAEAGPLPNGPIMLTQYEAALLWRLLSEVSALRTITLEGISTSVLLPCETVTPDGLRMRAVMVCDKLNDGGSCARHLELAADKLERQHALLVQAARWLESSTKEFKEALNDG